MSPRELANKIDWEGGVVSALQYGLRTDDLDDSNSELKLAWTKICDSYEEFFGPLMESFYSLLPEPEPEDE